MAFSTQPQGSNLGYLRMLQNSAHPPRYHVRQIGDGVSVISIAMLACVALFSPTIGLPPTGWPGLSLLFALLVLGTALGRSPGGITWLLELRPIKWIGIISYSFYLYHDFVLWTVYNRLDVPGLFVSPDLLKAIIAFGLTLLIAWASYVLIEQKFTMQLRRVASNSFTSNQATRQATGSAQK